LEQNLRTLRKKLRNTENAELIIQKVALETQAEIQIYVSDLVSLALSSVYDDAYEFKLDFKIKRGKTECSPVFTRDGKDYVPGKETGGGPVDIASFALRLALYCLQKGRINNTILLDEPSRFLDIKSKPRFAKLISRLSKELDVQFLIVTHDVAYTEKADKVFEIEKK